MVLEMAINKELINKGNFKTQCDCGGEIELDVIQGNMKCDNKICYKSMAIKLKHILKIFGYEHPNIKWYEQIAYDFDLKTPYQVVLLPDQEDYDNVDGFYSAMANVRKALRQENSLLDIARMGDFHCLRGIDYEIFAGKNTTKEVSQELKAYGPAGLAYILGYDDIGYTATLKQNILDILPEIEWATTQFKVKEQEKAVNIHIDKELDVYRLLTLARLCDDVNTYKLYPFIDDNLDILITNEELKSGRTIRLKEKDFIKSMIE